MPSPGSIRKGIMPKELTNKQLLAKIEALEKQVAAKQPSNHVMDVTDSIRKRNPVSGNSLPMKITDDHKNVTLYHTNGHQIGKFVGPLHPNNAEVEVQRFYSRGIILSLTKPTDVEIKAYKETDEWKKLDEEHTKKRKSKIKKRKNQDMSDLAKEIAKLSGKPVVNSVSEIPV